MVAAISTVDVDEELVLFLLGDAPQLDPNGASPIQFIFPQVLGLGLTSHALRIYIIIGKGVVRQVGHELCDPAHGLGLQCQDQAST